MYRHRRGKQWHLPDEFVALIAHHTKLDELLAAGPEKHGPACVALALLLPSCSDDEWYEYGMFIRGYCELTELTPDVLREVFQTVDADTTEFAPILSLPLPKVALVDYLKD